MIFLKDKDLMVQMGLPSPFIAADPLYSPISDASIMTHRVFPGLCGFVPCGDQSIAAVFIDQLPEDETLSGIIMLTTRTDAEGERQECWLVQVQSRANAWQFMTIDEVMPNPGPYAVLLEWRAGQLEEGYAMHDSMIAGMTHPDDLWLVGTDLEKQAYSRFALSSGFSTLAHPFQASGAIPRAITSPGSTIKPRHGPCEAMRAYPIEWYQA